MYAQQGYAFGCVSLCTYVRVHTYVYICQHKNRLFSALLLENLLLSVICCLLFEFKHIQCGLLHPVSYTDREIPFQIRCRGLPDSEYFLLSFNGTPHPLWARLYNSFDIMYVCRVAHAVRAECQQLVLEPTAHAVL